MSKVSPSPVTATHAALIQVRNLRITFETSAGPFEAVRGVSFDLVREKLGIVGESGSGKSLTGRSLMRLLPATAKVRADRLSFGEVDLLRANEAQMARIRGRRIGLILQDPKFSLNPVTPVGEQIAEAYRLHHGGRSREVRDQALAMLEAVKIREPARVFRLYPHEISGGMGQRVMIAMMLVAGPEVLIADEPTSALDVTVRLEVLSLLDELVTGRGLGLIFISHDLNLVRRFCDRVLIMYAGQVVETLPAAELARARHPYTQGLLASLPRIHAGRRRLPVLDRDPAWLQNVGAAR
jgi:peptide/nickel transport system ATP-binding protein